MLVDIHEAIEKWHLGDGEHYKLHEYLGMPLLDYALWVEGKLSAENLARYGYKDGAE